jgi:microcin C transport system substrate-binding protein
VDVKHSFDRLTSKEAAPQYQLYFSAITRATVLGERSIRFDFAEPNRELPLIAGSLPVFSRKWGLENGRPKPLDQIVMDTPIASGPYRIGKVNFGKDISYERDPDYWGRELNVRRGQFNFERITYLLYRDNVASFEAFKAGEFDFIQAFIAKDWARQYRGGKFASGELLKREWQHGNAVGFQGFLFNSRLPKLADPRVRRAIGLAMDFEWLNRQIFYGAYTRVRGYFTNSEFEAQGLPDAAERTLLASLRPPVRPEILDEPVPLPPSTEAPSSLRANLRLARDLLAQAGWTYRDGALRNVRGEPFTLEFLDSSGSMGRVVTPYIRVLERLGIQADYRIVDYAVYEKRLKQFDFEMISSRTLGRLVPGSELLQMYGSAQARTEGSSNLGGVADPVVDQLLERVMAAQDRAQLTLAVRALDRVLRHGHYAVPHWYSAVHRVAYRAGRFAQPAVVPRYYQPEGWALSCWWAATAGATGAEEGR